MENSQNMIRDVDNPREVHKAGAKLFQSIVLFNEIQAEKKKRRSHVQPAFGTDVPFHSIWTLTKEERRQEKTYFPALPYSSTVVYQNVNAGHLMTPMKESQLAERNSAEDFHHSDHLNRFGALFDFSTRLTHHNNSMLYVYFHRSSYHSRIQSIHQQYREPLRRTNYAKDDYVFGRAPQGLQLESVGANRIWWPVGQFTRPSRTCSF